MAPGGPNDRRSSSSSRRPRAVPEYMTWSPVKADLEQADGFISLEALREHHHGGQVRLAGSLARRGSGAQVAQPAEDARPNSEGRAASSRPPDAHRAGAAHYKPWTSAGRRRGQRKGGRIDHTFLVQGRPLPRRGGILRAAAAKFAVSGENSEAPDGRGSRWRSCGCAASRRVYQNRYDIAVSRAALDALELDPPLARPAARAVLAATRSCRSMPAPPPDRGSNACSSATRAATRARYTAEEDKILHLGARSHPWQVNAVYDSALRKVRHAGGIDAFGSLIRRADELGILRTRRRGREGTRTRSRSALLKGRARLTLGAGSTIGPGQAATFPPISHSLSVLEDAEVVSVRHRRRPGHRDVRGRA